MGGGKMLEMKKTAIAFDEKELMKLEQIITDQDQAEALKFLKQQYITSLSGDSKIDSTLTGGRARASPGWLKLGPGWTSPWHCLQANLILRGN